MLVVQLFLEGAPKMRQHKHLREVFDRNDCVYVFPEEIFTQVVSRDPRVHVHSPKHPDKPLAQYLLPKGKTQRGGIEGIFADFSSVGRLCQSAQTLLEESRNQDYPRYLAIGVPGELFEHLLESHGQPPEEKRTMEEEEEDINLSEAEAALLGEAARTFHGKSAEAHRVRLQIVEAAYSELPVMILGETGTGKEVVARFIHDHSRPDNNYMAVNCGAIPKELVESELFGHEAYAFSGAGPKSTPGLWELANSGTLFLDEIGDLPLNAQVKILRALEYGKIRRVKGTEDIDVNARIIAATHRDLFQMVEQGTFREDLFYRLRLFVIRTPAITEDPAQLEEEIRDFWRDVTEHKGPALSALVLKRIAKRSWVGNYRDLKNFLRALWDHWQRCHAEEVLLLHVKTIEERYGVSPRAPRDGAAGAVDDEVRRMRYMQHHAMCAEALRALQLTLEPAVKRGGTIPNDLEMRLRHGIAELALLLNKPHRFYDSITFHAIDDARNALEDLLQALPKGEAKIRTLAKRSTLPKVNAGLDATFKGT